MRLFGRRRNAWVAGAAGRSRGLGADDGGRTVGLAKVCEGDLAEVALAGLLSGGWRMGARDMGVDSACLRLDRYKRAGTYRKVHGSCSLSYLYRLMVFGTCGGGSGVRGSADNR